MLTIFNWKANPAKPSEAQNLYEATCAAAAAHAPHILVAPPPIYLASCSESRAALQETKIKPCGIAAQDCVPDALMPITGATTASMLKALGVRHAIIGHSERRMKLGESDELICAKIDGAMAQGITPILCVGERSRTSPAAAMKAVEKQLARNLEHADAASGKGIIIAYEPVWAIGGKQEVDADYAADVIRRIKQWCGSHFTTMPKVLYGGSVNSVTAVPFVRHGDAIDGFLVGSASLRPKEATSLIKKIYG
jgi:triosephosphate isomerase